MLELAEGFDVTGSLFLLKLCAIDIAGHGDALFLRATLLNIMGGDFGGTKGGCRRGNAGGGSGVAHPDEEVTGFDLLAEVDVELFNDSRGCGVGGELIDRLNFSVGGDGADEVLAGDFGDPDLDDIMGKELDTEEDQDGKQEEDAEKCDGAGSACLKSGHPVSSQYIRRQCTGNEAESL